MNKFLIKAFVFISIAIGVMLLCLSILNPRWVEGRKKIFLADNNIKNYDLLVMGSSRAEHVINVALFDTAKYKVFNIAEDGHGLVSNYLMLKVLLEKYHLTTKRVLLQVDESAFNGSVGFKSKFRDDFFISDIRDAEVFAAFRKYKGFSLAYVLHTFPFLGNLVYGSFKELPHLYNLSLRNAARKQYKNIFSGLGSTKGYEALAPMNNIITERKEFIIEQDDVHYFEAFVKLCQTHNIELILYRAPMLDCTKINSIKFDQYIAAFCATNGVRFIDLKCAYPDSKYYKDQMHIADSAATGITNGMIDSLKMR